MNFSPTSTRYAALSFTSIFMWTAMAAAEPVAAPIIDPASVATPSIAFTEDASAVKSYDKYFYFWRENAGFEEAYVDLRECDSYARGLAFRIDGSTPWDVNGPSIAGAFVGAIIDSIQGAAQRRSARRTRP